MSGGHANFMIWGLVKHTNVHSCGQQLNVLIIEYSKFRLHHNTCIQCVQACITDIQPGHNIIYNNATMKLSIKERFTAGATYIILGEFGISARVGRFTLKEKCSFIGYLLVSVVLQTV